VDLITCSNLIHGILTEPHDGIHIPSIAFHTYILWLVVLTILKNISQWKGLSHILWKITHVWNHQLVVILYNINNHIKSHYTNASEKPPSWEWESQMLPTLGSSNNAIREAGTAGTLEPPPKASMYLYDTVIVYVYLSIDRSIDLSIYLSIDLSNQSINLSIYQTIYLSINLSIQSDLIWSNLIESNLI
jgi:hypothetical protein